MQDDLFWRKVKRGAPDKCWPWMGAVLKSGYGALTRRGMSLRAHRWAYVLSRGKIAPDCAICHTCDNPICCNPFHLFAASQAVNIADCIAKGRKVISHRSINRGERHGYSKLTDAKVIDIRSRFTAGETQASIARRFRVCPATICRVVHNVGWTHIATPDTP